MAISAAKSFFTGSLDCLVTVQIRTSVPDGLGGATEAWGDLGTAWARIEPLSGDMRLIQGVQVTGITHRAIFRAGIPELKGNGARLAFDGRVFQIMHAFERGEQGNWLELGLKEVQA